MLPTQPWLVYELKAHLDSESCAVIWQSFRECPANGFGIPSFQQIVLVFFSRAHPWPTRNQYNWRLCRLVPASPAFRSLGYCVTLPGSESRPCWPLRRPEGRGCRWPSCCPWKNATQVLIHWCFCLYVSRCVCVVPQLQSRDLCMPEQARSMGSQSIQSMLSPSRAHSYASIGSKKSAK